MRSITAKHLFLSVLISSVFLSGCGEKKEAEKPKVKQPEIITLTLKDGKKIKIDANQFGISEFPAGDILSYEVVEDTRHLIDEKGNPIQQPVYRQELVMESKEAMESLIKFFYLKTPFIVNRRKQAGIDLYVRLVSTKDNAKIQALDVPYTVIDMIVMYPQSIGETSQEPVSTVTPIEDQISAVKSQIEMLKQSLDQGNLSIPERRTYEGQIVMLENELTKLNTIKDSQKKPDSDNETKEKPIKPAQFEKIKIKIISYMKRG